MIAHSYARTNLSAKFRKLGRGFSLVEVVVAVGIFALAIVGVIGLLGPTTKSIGDVADSDSASRVITAIQSQLQAGGFDAVRTNFNVPFFVSKDGSKVGIDGAPVWSGVSNTERFFEFQLVRNDGLSPVANDTTAGFLAFTIVLKWPAYALTSATTAERITDDSQKSVMIVPAAVTR